MAFALATVGGGRGTGRRPWAGYSMRMSSLLPRPTPPQATARLGLQLEGGGLANT